MIHQSTETDRPTSESDQSRSADRLTTSLTDRNATETQQSQSNLTFGLLTSGSVQLSIVFLLERETDTRTKSQTPLIALSTRRLPSVWRVAVQLHAIDIF